jgi:hypothetical protein
MHPVSHTASVSQRLGMGIGIYIPHMCLLGYQLKDYNRTSLQQGYVTCH